MWYKKLFFILLSCILMVQCSKPNEWWKEAEIGVMADSTDWEALGGPLKQVYEKVVRTPQIEKMFVLKYVTDEDFMRYTKFQYLILAATLESKGRVRTLIDNVLKDPGIRKGVEKGDHFVFIQKNQWAKNQLVVILVSKNLPVLIQHIQSNRDFLFGIFKNDFEKRLEKDMFHNRENKEEQQRLMSTFGWTIRLQKDYFLAQEISDKGFLWYRRMYPERWIFVRWINGGDSTLLNEKWVVGERNRIGSEYYGGDHVADQYLFSHKGTFLGRPAQITTGLWANEAKEVGGPFKNYTFYDALSERVYMIDLAVFAPGKDKLPYLRRMDIIAGTFKTVFE